MHSKGFLKSGLLFRAATVRERFSWLNADRFLINAALTRLFKHPLLLTRTVSGLYNGLSRHAAAE